MTNSDSGNRTSLKVPIRAQLSNVNEHVEEHVIMATSVKRGVDHYSSETDIYGKLLFLSLLFLVFLGLDIRSG